MFDPEGDYSEFRSAVVFGDAKSPPQLAEVVKLLERPEDSVVINIAGCAGRGPAGPPL